MSSFTTSLPTKSHNLPPSSLPPYHNPSLPNASIAQTTHQIGRSVLAECSGAFTPTLATFFEPALRKHHQAMSTASPPPKDDPSILLAPTPLKRHRAMNMAQPPPKDELAILLDATFAYQATSLEKKPVTAPFPKSKKPRPNTKIATETPPYNPKHKTKKKAGSKQRTRFINPDTGRWAKKTHPKAVSYSTYYNRRPVHSETGELVDKSHPKATTYSSYYNHHLVHSETGKPVDKSHPQAITYSAYYGRRPVHSETGELVDKSHPKAITYSTYYSRRPVHSETGELVDKTHPKAISYNSYKKNKRKARKLEQKNALHT